MAALYLLLKRCSAELTSTTFVCPGSCKKEPVQGIQGVAVIELYTTRRER